MALVAYKKTGLTGGTASDLDSIDGADLSGGEIAFVIYNGSEYTLELDESSGASENSPFVIAPDANPGTKRWLLKNVFGQNQVNLIKNPFSVWSNSDTNKGLGSGNYDSGGVTATIPGDTWTGNTSGATAKLISITVATGSWAGGDAAGAFTLGACAGRFHDNETITTTTGGADTLTINMPNSAGGVDLVQNGEFSVDTDPTPGWTASGSALTTDAGGQVTNMMTVTSSGDALGNAYQDLTTVIGKIYDLGLYFKKGTSDSGKYMIGTTGDEDAIYDSGALTDAAWAAKAKVFEATATTTRITMQTTDATTGETSLFDEISCYEITPCMTAANTLACDGFTKTTTLDIYRITQDTTHLKSLFGLQAVKTVATAEYLTWEGNLAALMHHYYKFRNQTWTIGIWVYSVTAADNVKAQIADSDATSASGFAGADAFKWLEIARGCGASITSYSPRFLFDGDIGDIAYISEPMLIKGSSIGEGNYVPSMDKIIELETKIFPTSLSNTTISSNLTHNLEAETSGKLPKGCRGVMGSFEGKCATAGKIIYLSGLVAVQLALYASVSNISIANAGLVICDANGDIAIYRNDTWTSVYFVINQALLR